MFTKRNLAVVLAALSMTMAATLPAQAQDARGALDDLVAKWTKALTTEDITGFLGCYWDDAVRINYGPDGTAEITQGMDELRAAEEKGFEAIDFLSLNLVYDAPVRFFPRNANPTYVYPNSAFGFMDIFEFEQRGGQYRIIKQYLLPHPTGP